jgi:hypothetical protein
MRSLHGNLSHAAVVLAALALVACSRDSGQCVGTTQTTGAAVPAPDPLGGGELTIQPPPRPATAPRTRSEPTPTGEPPPAQSKQNAPVDNPYTRPPLHESQGSNYTDVGVPYPLPNVPPEPRGPARPPPAAPPEAPPIPETSFGASTGYVEGAAFQGSSFGPDAGL